MSAERRRLSLTSWFRWKATCSLFGEAVKTCMYSHQLGQVIQVWCSRTRFFKPLLAPLTVVVLLYRCTDLRKAVTHFAFQVQQSLPSESSLSLIVSKDTYECARTHTPSPTQPSVFVDTPVYAHTCAQKVRFTHACTHIRSSARCLCAAFTRASCLPCPLIKAICSPGPSLEKSALFCSTVTSDTVVLAFEKWNITGQSSPVDVLH